MNNFELARQFKKDFPIFENNPGMIYLDSAASAQKPVSVIKAISDFYEKDYANIHRGIYSLSERATALFDEAREKVMRFLRVYDPKQIVFTRNSTEAINFVKYAWAEKNLQEGDVVLLTVLEHHANFVPWLDLAQKKGVKLKIVELNEEEGIRAEEVMEEITEDVKLVAISHMSNTLGIKIEVERVIAKARNMGITTLVDACQSVVHGRVDATEIGADFLVFSGHKLYGPTGVGVLCLSDRMITELPPFLMGGDMIKEVTRDSVVFDEAPAKFEAGTPDIAGVVGLGAAIDYVMGIGMDNIELNDNFLCDYTMEKLAEIDEVRVIGPQRSGVRGSIVSFVMDGVHPHDVAQVLADNNICVRAGHHCTQPLIEALGVPAVTRLSFGVYNSRGDVDRAVEVLREVRDMFKR